MYLGRSFEEAKDFLAGEVTRQIGRHKVMIGDDQVIEIFFRGKVIITYHADGRVILTTDKCSPAIKDMFNNWAPVGILGRGWRVVFYIQIGPGMNRRKHYVVDSYVNPLLFYSGINVGQPAILAGSVVGTSDANR